MMTSKKFSYWISDFFTFLSSLLLASSTPFTFPSPLFCSYSTLPSRIKIEQKTDRGRKASVLYARCCFVYQPHRRRREGGGESFWSAVGWLNVGHMPVLTLIHASPEIELNSKCDIWQLCQYCRVLTKQFSGFLLCKSESYWLSNSVLSCHILQLPLCYYV